jgi:hypothetical protein
VLLTSKMESLYMIAALLLNAVTLPGGGVSSFWKGRKAFGCRKSVPALSSVVCVLRVNRLPAKEGCRWVCSPTG